ncbi:DUF1707 domain-containing protein [Streptomyces sp. NPDC058045]|uniref:DUF1707 SHOCT-like domain-containing protein n=1 Tax=Streptomyces sp. NPDC058045 TaxID=3346311 RepID=UPI0036E3DDE4
MDLEKRPQQPAATDPKPADRPAAPVVEPPAPASLRASDADRDRVADILREALAEGRLTADEHAERVDGVYRAKTIAELEPLVRDLPAAGTRRTPGPARPEPPSPGELPAAPEDNLVAVFSASTRRGRWRIARRTHAYAVFGSVEIDLSEAIFEHRHVLIKAVSVFGNVEITVPENVSLRGSGGGVLGNFEVDTLDSAEDDAPLVHVEGVSVLGNIEARPKRGSLVRDLHHKLRKHLG